MLFVFLSVVVVCLTLTYNFKVYLDVSKPKQPNISDEILKRVEKLEQKEEIKRLRG